MLFSLFKYPITNTKPETVISVEGLAKKIKNDWKKETEMIRKFVDKKEQNEYKTTNLYYSTFAGIFNNRNDKDIEKYSGLIIIDIDNISNIEEIRKKINEDPFTMLSFVSPSGAGLKVIFQTNNTKSENHKDYFKSIQYYFLTKYNIKIDESGKDLSRACFLCYDPEVFINSKSTIWTDFESSEKEIKNIDYNLFDLDNLEKSGLKDCGGYYSTICSKCGKKAFLYKNNFLLICTHKNSCGYRENLLEKKIELKINELKNDNKNRTKRKEVYFLLKMTDEIERNIYFENLKTIWKVKIDAVRKDYENFTKEQIAKKYTSDKFDFRVPAGYQITEEGIILDGKKRISYEPYFINAIGFDKNTKIEYVELKHGKGEKKATRRVERQTIAITKNILEESKYGAPVDSGNALDLINFFRGWHSVNRDIFSCFEVVTQLGWYKKQFILPDRHISENGVEKNLKYIGNIKQNAYSEKGDLKKWVKTIRKLKKLKNGYVIRFLIYAGFSSVILEPLKLRSFIIHLHSDTSKGKTTALRLIASIFGKPEESYTITRWKSTKNFIIRYLEQLKNLPLIIDELSSETLKTHDDILYQFESGIGKGKASKDNPNAFETQRTFTTGMFSSGEPPILTDQSFTGANVRTWQFSGSPFGESNKKLINEIDETIKNNYGLALTFFLESFFLNKKEFFDENTENFYNAEATDIEARILKPLNAICKIGILVNGIFDLDFDVVSDMFKIFEIIKEPLKTKNGGNITSDKLMAEIKDEYSSNIDSFVDVVSDGVSGKQITEKKGFLPKKILGYKFGNDLGWIKTEFIKMWNIKKDKGTGGIYVINRLKEAGEIPDKYIRKTVDHFQVYLVYFKDFFEDVENIEEEKEGKLLF